MCSEMGFCFAALFSPVCINPGDTMKEPVCREHLLGSAFLISFFGQCRISRAAVRGCAGTRPPRCQRPAFPCLTSFSAAIPPPAVGALEEKMRSS